MKQRVSFNELSELCHNLFPKSKQVPGPLLRILTLQQHIKCYWEARLLSRFLIPQETLKSSIFYFRYSHSTEGGNGGEGGIRHNSSQATLLESRARADDFISDCLAMAV
jgi:hypothetical protein